MQTQQDFTEIPLYDHLRSYTYTRIVLLVAGVVILIINVAVWSRLGMTIMAFLISLLTMSVFLLLSYYRRHSLFPNSTGTLMIAYGEVHLLTQKNIQWSASLQDCRVEQVQATDTQLPTLQLYNQQRVVIRIQYLLPKRFRENTQAVESVVYSIFSKTDWEKLLAALR